MIVRESEMMSFSHQLSVLRLRRLDIRYSQCELDIYNTVQRYDSGGSWPRQIECQIQG